MIFEDFDDKTKVQFLRRAIINLASQLADEVESKSLYPQEISLRLVQPQSFKTFQREQNYLTDGMHVIFGIYEDGQIDIQAIRIDF